MQLCDAARDMDEDEVRGGVGWGGAGAGAGAMWLAQELPLCVRTCSYRVQCGHGQGQG